MFERGGVLPSRMVRRKIRKLCFRRSDLSVCAKSPRSLSGHIGSKVAIAGGMVLTQLLLKTAVFTAASFFLCDPLLASGQEANLSKVERSMRFNGRRCIDARIARGLGVLGEIETGQASVFVEPQVEGLPTSFLPQDIDVKCEVKRDVRKNPISVSCKCTLKAPIFCGVVASWKRNAGMCIDGSPGAKTTVVLQDFVDAPITFPEVSLSEHDDDFLRMMNLFDRERDRFDREICDIAAFRPGIGAAEVCKGSRRVRAALFPIRVDNIPCCKEVLPPAPLTDAGTLDQWFAGAPADDEAPAVSATVQSGSLTAVSSVEAVEFLLDELMIQGKSPVFTEPSVVLEPEPGNPKMAPISLEAPILRGF